MIKKEKAHLHELVKVGAPTEFIQESQAHYFEMKRSLQRYEGYLVNLKSKK